MIKIRSNVPLAQYTYYKIGGKARYFCEISTQINTDTQADQHRYYQDLIDALNWAEEKGLPVFVLGGGTNILVSDKGFEGLVIKMKSEKLKVKSQSSKFKIDNNKITISAGTKLADIVSVSLKHGLSGLEWAAGIPGTVGGAVRGNAGAFEGEMSSVIESIVAVCHSEAKPKNLINNEILPLHRTVQGQDDEKTKSLRVASHGLRVKKLINKQCKFGYRTSIIKEQGGIVLSAVFALKKLKIKSEKLKIIEEAKNHIKYRKERHPLEYPSCGSTFKNVNIGDIGDIGLIGHIGEIIPAGLLIAKAGLSGKRMGDAQISEKHSNFIVNLGKAKASDVYELIQLCQKEVYEKFGVKLEREVELVGFADQR